MGRTNVHGVDRRKVSSKGAFAKLANGRELAAAPTALVQRPSLERRGRTEKISRSGDNATSAMARGELIFTSLCATNQTLYGDQLTKA